MNDSSRPDYRRDDSPSYNRTADIAIALSVGLLAGVAGALLLAPASGRNTRRRIGEMAGEVADRTGALAGLAADTLKDQAGRLDEALTAGKQAYRKAKDDFAG